MGEVYRAEDLVLNQEVALKFLAPRLAGNPQIRERFFNEVRVARQVTHPNVCRVHDIGEVEGRPYLSMEYVDGEDLASLLRRIGRLPRDKAVEISRQLCAGLASAHAGGLIHRDLKPANIMIDGRGKVRITDFGLAGVAEDVRDIRSGTPAYMAPEQLQGKEVSYSSDVYSMGLVLYEVFTGRPAFHAESLAELQTLHDGDGPSTPSTLIEDMDPSVERVILRCMEFDPVLRPKSVLAVAGALPGGDPLAEALAAGEIPTPEMVAASGEEGTIPVSRAAGLLAIVLVTLAIWIGVAPKYQVEPQLDLQLPPAALEVKAREIVDTFVGERVVGDSGGGFTGNSTGYLWITRKAQQTGDAWSPRFLERPSELFFWYRESRARLEVRNNRAAQLSFSDPPANTTGETRILLLPNGNLERFEHIPPQVEAATDDLPELSWGELFRRSGLNAAAFSSTPPTWTPPRYSDSRFAWIGSLDDYPGEEIRVEAAAYRGTPTMFRVIGPWTRPERDQAVVLPKALQARDIVNVTLILAILSAALYFARLNILAGRGDRRGAFRIGLLVFLGNIASWVLTGHHHTDITQMWVTFARISGMGLFLAFLCWAVYIALEPYLRKRFPEQIVGWSRVLSGRARDPLVQRDLLIGMAAGMAMVLLSLSMVAVGRAAGDPSAKPLSTSIVTFGGAAATIGWMAYLLWNQVLGALLTFYVWFLLRWGLRKSWAASLVMVVLIMFMDGSSEGFSLYRIPFLLISAAVFVFVLSRYGLLALAAMAITATMVSLTIVPRPLGGWYAPGSWLVFGVVGVAALFAFRVSAAPVRSPAKLASDSV
jgi:serine/threonine-protein kinase